MSIFDTATHPFQPPFGRYCLLDTPDARVRLAALTTMAATLAHEISQPLTAATNYIHACAHRLRARGENCEDLLRLIELAGRETIKAGEIIRRMRSFIVSGRISGRRESLAAMIDAVRSELPCPDGEKVEVVKAIQRDADYVVADRVQIEQVLSIILMNACEALIGRSVRGITISAARLGDQVVLRIQDTGPGFSAYAFAHLFEPLFTTKANGLGLGLPIARAIVQAHRGRLWAERPAGGGATFGVSLPAADQA